MSEELDPASVYCAAKSLEEAVRAEADRNGWNLSDLYSGWDGFLRDVVHAATVFETWACEHVDFNKLGEVWPYYLDDNFGDAVVATVDTTRLRAHFHGDVGAAVCRDIAAKLKLPLNS